CRPAAERARGRGPAAQRPAARRRLDRDRPARGRPAAFARRGKRSRRNRRRLRHGVLVVTRADRGRDRAVPGPPQSRALGARGASRGAVGRALRRLGGCMTPTVTKTEKAARDEALTQLGEAFKGVMGAVRRLRGRDTQRPGELGFAQYRLLFGLSTGDHLSTGQLATVADLAPATVTQMR